jgi:uncharacterized protein YgiM (DUF1202 family)
VGELGSRIAEKRVEPGRARRVSSRASFAPLTEIDGRMKMQASGARRAFGGVAAIALAGLVAACASQPQPQSYQPPPAPTPAYGSTAPIAVYSVTTPLHVRAAPTVNAPIIGTLQPGTRVQPLGPPQEGVWVEVRTPAGTGWVNGRYLSPS